jgi:hypothetical protein
MFVLSNFFFLLVGWDLSHQVLRPLLAYCTAPDDRWGWLWSNWWNEDWQGEPQYSEKTCPSATLSTTNPTWPDPGANPGRRGGTNRLSYLSNINPLRNMNFFFFTILFCTHSLRGLFSSGLATEIWYFLSSPLVLHILLLSSMIWTS